ncbi:MAG TPA: autotransporter-associated beta strand repeat-containing protein [Tepidisphaeraceae bacterium]
MRKQAAVNSKLVCAMASAAVLAMLSCNTARANLYWDTNGSKPGATDTTAADGTWGSDNFWSNDPTGNSPTGAWNDYDTAIFSAGSNALTANVAVSGTQNFGGLQFVTGTTTLGGSGTLNYNNDGSVNPGVVVPTGQTATINTIISGNGQIQLSGGGTLLLGTTQTQANTFDSFSGVDAGGDFLSTGAISISGGSTLQFAGENNATPGAGNPLGVAPAAAENYSAGGSSAYITINDGTLRNTIVDSSGTASFVLPFRGIQVLSGGATFDIPAASSVLNLVDAVDLTSGGLLTKTGAGTLKFSNGPSPNLTGGNGSAIDIEGGEISIFSSLNLGTESYVRLNGGTLLQTNSGNGGSFISGSTTLKIGPNGGTIGYASTGTGTSAIYGNSNSPNAEILGDGGTTTNGGAQTLTVTGKDEFRAEGAGMANNTFAKLDITGGALFRAGYDGVPADEIETTFGAVPLAFLADAITLDNGFIGSSWATVLSKNRGITLTANGGGDIISGGSMTINGTITGPGAFSVYGVSSTSTAVLVLTTNSADSPNNWTGGTVLGAPINALFTTATYGNLSVSAGSVVGSGPVTFLDGKLTLSNTAQTLASLISASGIGTVALGASTALTLNASSGSTSFGGTIIQNGTTTGASVTKNGAGTQILTGVNTYTGGTTINAGALETPALADFGTGNITINGGALVVTDSSQFASVGAALAASYDSDKWDTGTFRSTAITNNTRNLGYAIVGGQVEVMVTLPGDTNLDGIVNTTDLGNMSASGTTWSTGDFNYDGKVNSDDYALFMLGSALPSLPGAPVPEPGVVAIFLAAAPLIGRRRKLA